jgi:hypothetical protein
MVLIESKLSSYAMPAATMLLHTRHVNPETVAPLQSHIDAVESLEAIVREMTEEMGKEQFSRGRREVGDLHDRKAESDRCCEKLSNSACSFLTSKRMTCREVLSRWQRIPVSGMAMTPGV